MTLITTTRVVSTLWALVTALRISMDRLFDPARAIWVILNRSR
jgi:hypothetical protein